MSIHGHERSFAAWCDEQDAYAEGLRDASEARRVEAGSSSSAAPCSAPPLPLNPGQVWWDEHRKWCDGSDTLDVVHLLLSADREGDLYLWRCAFFMWVGVGGVGETGYCGAHDRKFTEDEVRLMTYVGGIDSIKNFKAQNVRLDGTA